jgi:hypothetical protein
MDAATLLWQLHDDHHDCMFLMDQYSASDLVEIGLAHMYLKTLNEVEELVKKASRTLSRLISFTISELDEKAAKEVCKWKKKVAKITNDVMGHKSEVICKALHLYFPHQILRSLVDINTIPEVETARREDAQEASNSNGGD